MNFQQKVKEFAEKYNLTHGAEIAALDLVSEIGEVAKEILKTTDYGKKPAKHREELKAEIGDVFYSLINLANYYNIDLEEALEIVLKKYEERLNNKGTASSKS